MHVLRRYQDLLAYDYYTALVALAQSTAPAFTSPGHVVSPAPAILPPRAWLLGELADVELLDTFLQAILMLSRKERMRIPEAGLQ